MGLLEYLFGNQNNKKHSAEIEMSEEEFAGLVAKKIVESTLGTSPTEEEIARMKEQERQVEEGRRLRKEAILAHGVDESLFTENGAFQDALYLLNEFAPQYDLIDIDVTNGKVNIDYQNLTKTRKLPKNVVIEHVDSYGKNQDDNAILHIKKLKDGAINMADIHLWHNHLRHSVYVRTKDNKLQITCVVFSDARKNYEETLCAEEDILYGKDPSEILNDSILKTWK